MFKKEYLLLTLIVSQAALLKAESEYILKEELFQRIVHRNETLRQIGRQVPSDPFEESIIVNKKNGESITEKIKIFVTQQNNALNREKQLQYLLKSETNIQHLKERLIAEQGTSNKHFFLLQLLSGTCTASSLIKAIDEYKKNENCLGSLITSGLYGCITIGLGYLIDDLRQAVDSCTNSTYTIETLKLEIQQQKNNQSAPVNDEIT